MSTTQQDSMGATTTRPRLASKRLGIPSRHWFVYAAAMLLALTAPGRLYAQSSGLSQDSNSQWEHLTFPGSAVRLFTPSSGAFFALTRAHDLFRSDDAGGHWWQVNLPPLGRGDVRDDRAVVVDPTDHQVVYASGADGLYQSSDDAASWHLILPYSPSVGWKMQSVAVSPADHHLLFAHLADQNAVPEDFTLRSRDGGQSWQTLRPTSADGRALAAGSLTLHPSDPRRVFLALGNDLYQSTDQGEAFALIHGGAGAGNHQRLLGGRGALPVRWYTGVWHDDLRDGGGSIVYRSNDDGRTWTEVLAFRDGVVANSLTVGGAGTLVSGLAYDPLVPDHVWVALTTIAANPDDPGARSVSGRIHESHDGGASWADVDQAVGLVDDLALGVDGRNLYAATSTGVWRLPLE
jgi:hypothetical protein